MRLGGKHEKRPRGGTSVKSASLHVFRSEENFVRCFCSPLAESGPFIANAQSMHSRQHSAQHEAEVMILRVHP